MKMRYKVSVSVIFFTLMLLSMHYSSAVGISSPQIGLIVFEPNMVLKYGFYLTNADKIESYVSGDLQEYVTIIDPAPMTGPRNIDVIIDLPAALEPGFYTIYIGSKELAVREGTLGGVAWARTPIRVVSLYPGKFPKWSFSVDDINLNGISNMTVGVHNYGKEAIAAAQGVITVYSPDNKTIDTLYTDTQPVASNMGANLVARFDSSKYGLNPGIYKAIAKASYDNINVTEQMERPFLIGSLDVIIVSATPEVYANATNKYEINIESDWSGNIKDVYATIQTPNGKSLKTPNVDLIKPGTNTAKASAILETYWETQGVAMGKYELPITLYYAGKTTQNSMPVNVISGKAAVVENPRTGFQVLGFSNDKITIFNLTLPITLFLMLILAIIVFFNLYYFMMRKKDKELASPESDMHKSPASGKSSGYKPPKI